MRPTSLSHFAARRVVASLTAPLAALALALGACGGAPTQGSSTPTRASAPSTTSTAAAAPTPHDADLAAAEAAIDAAGMLASIKALASDELEGRAPGTRGEELATAYIERAMREAGLAPGNPDGTYSQAVPLVGATATAKAEVTIGGKTITLAQPKDIVVSARPFAPELAIDRSEIVFAGYGIVAPEQAGGHGWDDFKGVDVRGKTVLVLVNDPELPDPNDASKLDESVFRGRAMTYYGRYTYKWESCAARGAAACLVVHDTKAAAYPWQVVESSFGRENFQVDEPSSDKPMIAGWIHGDAARALAAAAGKDWEALKRAALSRDFRPVSLGARATAKVTTVTRRVQSRNVVGKLEGGDPKKKDEVIVYSAHWDHLGKDERLAGDQIFNGAVDNASGVAALLALARGFAQMKARPPRTIVFLAVTAEEKGLLGTKYYVDHPLYPLRQTLCDLNMDSMNVVGRAKSVVNSGLGLSTLDDAIAAEAAAQGRIVAGDPRPEAGGYFRSDHFEFARKGVPSWSVGSGHDIVGKPEGYGARAREEYVAKRYHKPADEVDPSWDLSGAVEDTRLLLRVGYRVATTEAWPTWKPGAEYKATRDAMLAR